MKKQDQNVLLLICSAGLIALLSMAVLVPVSSGILQVRHRVARQIALRRSKLETPAVKIVVREVDLITCYFPKEHELLIDGLRYDVISVEKEGAEFIFKAVPDLKETRLEALAVGSILYSNISITPHSGFRILDGLFLPALLLLQDPVSDTDRSTFTSVNASKLTGFEQVFVPPPEWS